MTNTNKTFFNANPMVNTLSQLKPADSTTSKATYKGIFSKTAFFILMSGIGYALYYLAYNMFFKTGLTELTTGGDTSFAFTFSIGALVALGIALVAGIICPIVARRNPKLAAACGSIYAAVQGFMIAGIIQITTSSGYLANVGAGQIATMALIGTAIIVLVMAFLYQHRIIRATNKFNAILLSAFVGMIFLGLVTTVLAFIPATSAMVAAVVSNPVISIAISAIGLVIASLFLISDFSVIEQTVENGLDKKYEWTAAFGLAVTIIWIYMKVLQILLKVLAKRS